MYSENMCGRGKCCPNLEVYDENRYVIREICEDGTMLLWEGTF